MALYGKTISNSLNLQRFNTRKITRFAPLLNRIRIGEHTDDYIDLLNTRKTILSAEHYPTTVTHIFAYNKDGNDHNTKMLETLSGLLYTFFAKDSKRNEQTRRVELSEFAENAGGLSKKLVLEIGARVILTKNMNVTNGLVQQAL